MNAQELMNEKRYSEADAEMAKARTFREDDIQVIKSNVLALQVCSPFNADETTTRVNAQFPAGTSGGWQFDPGQGEVKCSEHDNRTHGVFLC